MALLPTRTSASSPPLATTPAELVRKISSAPAPPLKLTKPANSDVAPAVRPSSLIMSTPAPPLNVRTSVAVSA